MFLQTRSQKKHNEDAIGARSGLWVVCDGASSLGTGGHMPDTSDAAWLAQSIVKGLLERAQDPRPLEELLGETLDDLAAVFPAVCEDDSPSAAVALLRVDPQTDRAEALVLGDCTLLAATRDGIVRLQDPAVGALDAIALEAMADRQKQQGGSFLLQRPFVQPILQASRRRRNQPDGYFIADLSGLWKGHALTWSAPASSLIGAALFSDGFEQLQNFEALSDRQFLQTIFLNPAQAMDRLYVHQENDPQCEQLHRLKKRDDTSLIVINDQDLQLTSARQQYAGQEMS